MGIPVTAFAIFWMALASQQTKQISGPGSFFPLFGIPFIVVGLGMLSSPLWRGRKALRTVYALTDQRAIIFEGGFFGGVAIFFGKRGYNEAKC
jgi:hypothetical protein